MEGLDPSLKLVQMPSSLFFPGLSDLPVHELSYIAMGQEQGGPLTSFFTSLAECCDLLIVASGECHCLWSC